MTDVSRQLVFLFFASNALKKDPGVDAARAPRPREVRQLGVLGAGFMGAGIASVAVQQGTLVRLKDTDTARIGKGLAAIARRRAGAAHAPADHAAAVRRLPEPRRRNDGLLGLRVGRSRDRGGVRGSRAQAPGARRGRAGASSRRRSTRRTRARFRSRASPRRRDASGARARHAFLLARARMPLLEVIVTPADRRQRRPSRAVAYGKQLGKTVIVVNDGPGFYTTRTLSAYMNEAGRLLDEGASIESIDTRARRFRISGRADHAARRGRDRRRRQGRSRAGARRSARAWRHRRRCGASSRRGAPGRKGGKGFYRYDASGEQGQRRPERLRGHRRRRGARSTPTRSSSGACWRWSTRRRAVSRRVFFDRRATATSGRCSGSASRPSAAVRSATSTAYRPRSDRRSVGGSERSVPRRGSSPPSSARLAARRRTFYPRIGTVEWARGAYTVLIRRSGDPRSASISLM